MPPDFNARMRTLAEVVVRIGLNLQPGQSLLITDPYDLQGVHPDALGLAEAVRAAADTEVEILAATPARLRTLAVAGDLAGYAAVVSEHTRRLERHLDRGGAFLFLTGSCPQLYTGVSVEHTTRIEATKWQHFGPVIQHLIRGAAQWTLLPGPSTDWARLAGTDLAGLWATLFSALRLDAPDPLADWRLHLAAIAWQRDELNRTRPRRLCYTGPGTELSVVLPRSHRWCTTQLTTNRGTSFVANLPTEELFTAPHKHGVNGRLRACRPVTHGGDTLSGIELEFRRGRVVAARAEAGEDLLQHLLATDDGSARLGEVALVPGREGLAWAGRSHRHILLDENATHHVALGDAYRFCSRAWFPLALNSSQLHLDLPLDAEPALS